MISPPKIRVTDEMSTKGSAAASSFDASTYMAGQLVDEMSNAELVRVVENETRSNRELTIENHMFERYLTRAEPQLLVNIDQMMQQAEKVEARQQRITTVASRMGSISMALSSSMSVHSLRKPTGVDSARASISNIPYELKMLSATPSLTRTMKISPKEGPTINLSHKVDMATREMEELRLSFEHLTRVYTVNKAHLKAEIEEISTMVGEIKATVDELVDKVIVKGVEELTKKISAAVFIRFMEDWFKKMDLLSGQLRLKTNTYKTLLKRLTQQFEEKIELGESLSRVDFDFQEIQKLEVTKELARKNMDLALLKKETAHTHREFTAFKDRLAEQLATLDKLKSKTSDQERSISVMERDADDVFKDIEVAQTALDRITRIRQVYSVPNVQEYAGVKEQGRKLKIELRNWSRRTGLQHKTLVSTRQRLHHLKEELLC